MLFFLNLNNVIIVLPYKCYSSSYIIKIYECKEEKHFKTILFIKKVLIIIIFKFFMYGTAKKFVTCGILPLITVHINSFLLVSNFVTIINFFMRKNYLQLNNSDGNI